MPSPKFSVGDMVTIPHGKSYYLIKEINYYTPETGWTYILFSGTVSRSATESTLTLVDKNTAKNVIKRLKDLILNELTNRYETDHNWFFQTHYHQFVTHDAKDLL